MSVRETVRPPSRSSFWQFQSEISIVGVISNIPSEMRVRAVGEVVIVCAARVLHASYQIDGLKGLII